MGAVNPDVHRCTILSLLSGILDLEFTSENMTKPGWLELQDAPARRIVVLMLQSIVEQLAHTGCACAVARYVDGLEVMEGLETYGTVPRRWCARHAVGWRMAMRRLICGI